MHKYILGVKFSKQKIILKVKVHLKKRSLVVNVTEIIDINSIVTSYIPLRTYILYLQF